MVLGGVLAVAVQAGRGVLVPGGQEGLEQLLGLGEGALLGQLDGRLELSRRRLGRRAFGPAGPPVWTSPHARP